MARSALLLRQARLHRKLAFRPRLRARPRRAYRPHARFADQRARPRHRGAGRRHVEHRRVAGSGVRDAAPLLVRGGCRVRSRCHPRGARRARGCERRTRGGVALARPRRGHRALNTTVWIECGREPISTDAAPTTTAYCPPRGVGFMTTTATLPSALTKAVVSSMLRLGDARIRLAPGRMNFEKWPR